MVKNLPAMWETWIPSLGREEPLEKGMSATPVFLPGEFHGQRSLRPGRLQSMGCKESDQTEQLIHTLGKMGRNGHIINIFCYRTSKIRKLIKWSIWGRKKKDNLQISDTWNGKDTLTFLWDEGKYWKARLKWLYWYHENSALGMLNSSLLEPY